MPAAEILAVEANSSLYRVDPAAVVSKSIGETERNLARIFSEAEAVGAILFFDGADALFGRRSEVRETRDRYAETDIDHLPERLEAIAGITILATNRRQARRA